MKKIIVAAVIALSLLLIFTGCSGTSGGEVTDTTQGALVSTDNNSSAYSTGPVSSVPGSTDNVTDTDGNRVDKNDNLSENISDAMDSASTDASNRLGDVTE